MFTIRNLGGIALLLAGSRLVVADTGVREPRGLHVGGALVRHPAVVPADRDRVLRRDLGAAAGVRVHGHSKHVDHRIATCGAPVPKTLPGTTIGPTRARETRGAFARADSQRSQL
jgi:hypothetical protein